MNAIQLIKGKERWSMIDENTWNMILGKSGQLPRRALGTEEILASGQSTGARIFPG